MSSAASAPKSPEDWDQIGVGSVVLAEDDPRWLVGKHRDRGERGRRDPEMARLARLSHLRAAANRTRAASASSTALSKHDPGLGQPSPAVPAIPFPIKHETSP